MTGTSFSVWVVDEPEFVESIEYKFSALTHPVNMALGTHGKNDHLAKATVEVLADWALRKLFVACAKVLWWTALSIIKRALEKLKLPLDKNRELW